MIAWSFIPGLNEACEKRLQAYGINHAFFHLPLDDAPFSTNSTLAQAFDLQNIVEDLPINGYMCARIGYLPKSFAQAKFKHLAENLLNEEIQFFSNRPEPIHKVCLAAGGGSMTEYIQVGVQHDCGVYLTGEYSMNSQMYAELAGINLAVGSHTGTERLGVIALAKLLSTGTGMNFITLEEKRY